MPDDEEVEADIVHHWCCNADRALCGEDLSGGEDRDAASSDMCVVCVDLAGKSCVITCPLVVFT